MKEYATAEEFLAIQTQNVYLSLLNRKQFYFSHTNSRLASKDEIYKAIRTDNETLFTLRHYLLVEPFAQAVAKLAKPDFNCGRDLGRLDVIL